MSKKLSLLLLLAVFFTAFSTAGPNTGNYLIVGMNAGDNNKLGGMLLVNDTWDKGVDLQPDHFQDNVNCEDPAPNSCQRETGWILVVEKDGFTNDNEYAAYKAFSGKKTDPLTGKLADLTGPIYDSTRKTQETYHECWEKPCEIMNKEYGPVDGQWGGFPGGDIQDAYDGSASEYSIEMANDDLAPEDPIIVGAKADEDGSTGIKQFHLCDSETEGKIVYTKPSVGSGLNEYEGNSAGATNPYKCVITRYGADWIEKGECNDGTDNDRDGSIDNDPNCDTGLDNEAEYEGLNDETAMIPFVENNELKIYQPANDISTSSGVRAREVGGIADPDRDNHPEVLYTDNRELRLWDEASGQSRTLVEVDDLPGDLGIKEVGPLHSPSKGNYWAFFRHYDEGEKIKFYDSRDDEIQTFNDNCGYFGMSPSFKDFNGDGDKNILTRMNGPQIEIADPTSCSGLEPYRDDSNQYAYPGGVGDLDADDEMEIAYSMEGEVAHADGDSYTPLGVDGSPGPIADIDDDGNQEIVFLNGDSMRSIDMNTGNTDTLNSLNDKEEEEPGLQSIGGVYMRGNQNCDGPTVGVREYEEQLPHVDVTQTVREKVAFMDPNPSGQYEDLNTGCRFEDYDDTVETGNPDVFLCDEEDGSNESDIEKEDYCDGLADSENLHTPEGYHSGTALAVKYYIPKGAIPLGQAYADSDGFKNVKFDNIPRAERSYVNCQTAQCSTSHDEGVWDSKNVSDSELYSENPIDVDRVREMWNPSNATGQYSDGIRNSVDFYDKEVVVDDEDYDPDKWETSISDESVFRGGFYPECREGLQWRYDDAEKEWRCTGDLDMEVQFYAFDTDDFYGTTKTGFFLMPYIFRTNEAGLTSRTPYYLARERADKTQATLDELTALCWGGGPEDQPDTYDATTANDWFAQEVTGIGTDPRVPIPVIGELEPPNENLVDYSCRFEFTNSEGEQVTAEGQKKLVTRDEVAETTRAQSILNDNYESYVSDTWFDESKVCDGSCDMPIDKDDLDSQVGQSFLDETRDAWQNNLSYNFNEINTGDTDSDLSCYLKQNC